MKTKQTLIQICLLYTVLLLQVATGEAQPAIKIDGSWHSLFLKSDGSLWAMGDNGDGQLGDAPTNSINSLSRLWPAVSRRLPPEATTACFSRAMAVCGAWGTTVMASWATALIILVFTNPNKLWPVARAINQISSPAFK